MRLAIMQPYFFPYLGHFSLIAACDEWIVFDISQYTKRSWMNRNRVIDPAGGWKWITVPLAHTSMHLRSHQAMIGDPAAARRSVQGHLSHYRRAPHYRQVAALIEDVFTDDPSLTRLNVRALAAVCGYIGLDFNHRICSELALDLPRELEAGDWARAICLALEARSYVNPIGGRSLFDPESYARCNIALHFLQAEPFYYQTPNFFAEPNLSILDVMMWNDPQSILAAVKQFSLIPGLAERDLSVPSLPLSLRGA